MPLEAIIISVADSYDALVVDAFLQTHKS
ncbi:hypothetical protein [Clostridium swellfunianum]